MHPDRVEWKWKHVEGENPLPLYYFGAPVVVEESADTAKVVIVGGYNLREATADTHVLKLTREIHGK
jgi:hypothetical protein